MLSLLLKENGWGEGGGRREVNEVNSNLTAISFLLWFDWCHEGRAGTLRYLRSHQLVNSVVLPCDGRRNSCEMKWLPTRNLVSDGMNYTSPQKMILIPGNYLLKTYSPLCCCLLPECDWGIINLLLLRLDCSLAQETPELLDNSIVIFVSIQSEFPSSSSSSSSSSWRREGGRGGGGERGGYWDLIWESWWPRLRSFACDLFQDFGTGIVLFKKLDRKTELDV